MGRSSWMGWFRSMRRTLSNLGCLRISSTWRHMNGHSRSQKWDDFAECSNAFLIWGFLEMEYGSPYQFELCSTSGCMNGHQTGQNWDDFSVCGLFLRINFLNFVCLYGWNYFAKWGGVNRFSDRWIFALNRADWWIFLKHKYNGLWISSEFCRGFWIVPVNIRILRPKRNSDHRNYFSLGHPANYFYFRPKLI